MSTRENICLIARAPFLTDRSKAVLLLRSVLLFVFRFCLCHTVLSVSCIMLGKG